MRLSVLAFVLILFGCQPRGEFTPLDKVYELAVARFERALQNSNTSFDQKLKDIYEILGLVISDGLNEDLRILGLKLADLIPYTNPTVRPSLYEQIDTCLKLAEIQEISKEKALLLASRILNVLSSELETTAFRYSH